MPLAQWSTRRILAIWCAAIVLVLTVNILSASESFKSALFFDYIFQLVWIVLLLPVVVLTYIWANAHLSDPVRDRVKMAMIATTIVLVMLWLRFSCTRFR